MYDSYSGLRSCLQFGHRKKIKSRMQQLTRINCFSFMNVCFPLAHALIFSQKHSLRELMNSVRTRNFTPFRSVARGRNSSIDESQSSGREEVDADRADHHNQHVRSFHRRSASVCAHGERFHHRSNELFHESRHNPYIGYFLRHDTPGGFSVSLKSPNTRGGSARLSKPLPAIKTSLSIASTANPSPSTPNRTVTFSNTVRRSSLVTSHWDGAFEEPRSLPLSVTVKQGFFDILASSGQYASHGVPF